MMQTPRFLADCCYWFRPVINYSKRTEKEIDKVVGHLSSLGYQTDKLTTLTNSTDIVYIVATRTGDCYIVPDESGYPQSEYTYIAKTLDEFCTITSVRIDTDNNQYFINAIGQWWHYSCQNNHILNAAYRMGFRRASIEDFKRLFTSGIPSYRLSSVLHSRNCRAQGHTTRAVDEYIQKLFQNAGEWVTIHDHYRTRRADEMLIQRIYDRMLREHAIRIEVMRGEVKCRINPKDINFLI